MNGELKEILDRIETASQIFDCLLKPEECTELLDYITNLQQRIDKAIEYIEKDTRWFDSEYASIYGELCKCKGFNTDRLEVMINPSNLLKILKGDGNE